MPLAWEYTCIEKKTVYMCGMGFSFMSSFRQSVVMLTSSAPQVTSAFTAFGAVTVPQTALMVVMRMTAMKYM